MVGIKRLSAPILCPNFSLGHVQPFFGCKEIAVFIRLLFTKITIVWPRIPKIGIHVAFNFSHIASKIQFFRFNRISVTIISINSILIYQNGL